MTVQRKNKHIFVFGIFAVDISFYVDKKVNPGETIIAKDSNIGPGGKASNQAISARKLGGNTTLITRLGNDNFYSYANTIWGKENDRKPAAGYKPFEDKENMRFSNQNFSHSHQNINL